jgi:hypothetical protein
MNLRIYIPIVFLLISGNLFSQDSSRINRFLIADSIVVIKHSTIKGSTTIITDKDGNDLGKSFLVNGEINSEIILNRINLNQNQINEFIKIIKRTPNSRMSGNCNDPHHAILIYKAGQFEYIDYCFKCSSYSTGPEVIKGMWLDENQWKELKNYFTNLKLISE